jgi:hypothetical protein
MPGRDAGARKACHPSCHARGPLNALAEALPNVKSGTLRFWGAWFGRRYDNLHWIVSCELQGEDLSVRFDEGEVLRVWAPRRATIDENNFRIVEANRVRWEWFRYGRPKNPANLYFEDFTRQGTPISTETNVDWYSPPLQTDASLPAVEIL